MDFIRSAYRTRMIFWQDDTIGIPVRWFFTDKGASTVPYYSQFYSSTWDDRYTFRDVGDVNFPHPYYKGGGPRVFAGQHPCGDSKAWADGGITGVTPGIAVGSNGESDCCRPFTRGVVLSSGSSMRLIGFPRPARWITLFSGSDLLVSGSSSIIADVTLPSGSVIDVSAGVFYSPDVTLPSGSVMDVSAVVFYLPVVTLPSGSVMELTATINGPTVVTLPSGSVMELTATINGPTVVTLPSGSVMELSAEAVVIIPATMVMDSGGIIVCVAGWSYVVFGGFGSSGGMTSGSTMEITGSL